MTPEEKLNKLCEYPGFVLRTDIKGSSVMYFGYLTFPSGDESNHYYEEDRDKVVEKVFERFELLVNNTCYIVEMAKPCRLG
jgi:hypothetical protein